MRGGKRPGAGRPRGSATKKTRAVADAAALEGVTPLEVMLQAMRAHHGAGRFDEAAAIAKDAAPFMHPRLASIDQNVSGSFAYTPVEVQVAARDPIPLDGEVDGLDA